MKKFVKMLHILNNYDVEIGVDNNTVTVVEKEGKELFSKEVPSDEINSFVSTMINNHFDKGYVITTMNLL
jgi:hypothetical protein